MTEQADLTGLLQAWSEGNPEALAQLVPLVQRQLRDMARRLLAAEHSGGGWQPSDLVHESYLRLLEAHVIHWQDRRHFFATTARMMRHVLVDAARARLAAKRGGGARPLEIDSGMPEPTRQLDLVALDDALDALSAIDPRPSQVVELRFFGGFSVQETAEALNISPRTVLNDWNTARAWLHQELSPRSRAAS